MKTDPDISQSDAASAVLKIAFAVFVAVVLIAVLVGVLEVLLPEPGP